MRVNANIIEEEGERVSPYSKFYIWEDKLFEPVYYGGKKCKTYKAISEIYRINKIIHRIKQLKAIPTVSSVCGVKLKMSKNKYKINRFEILDL